ncbi:hypothetical protein [Lederbergia citri]|uniref:Oxidoreductase FAD/NAD(P)-binding domain-containing protein n=1 Tax=Lederbergia citri TaxID=2833580 RepID=A0A942YHX5_9BACI|nr:hypothetical protein [Lederbergia citri]MBS4196294.1 hypothetical protein [Lederbergia citri]
MNIHLKQKGKHRVLYRGAKEFLQDKIDKNTICYVCGPVPFLRAVVSILENLGLPENNIRYEFFGPAMQLQKEKATV